MIIDVDKRAEQLSLLLDSMREMIANDEIDSIAIGILLKSKRVKMAIAGENLKLIGLVELIKDDIIKGCGE